ncbi:MAG: GatB/YqeY domain-containing protein [Flavobacteriaceae bacterium]|nr:GatB/YqeY domain-containing protein [Flavobacteriaceae bacterium]
MSLSKRIMDEMKTAMKEKNSQKLQALRAVKSAILMAQTESSSNGELSEASEIALLQKLVKQRKDSAEIYKKQDREDLAAPELSEAAVIEEFLPKQMTEEEVAEVVDEVIKQTGASSMADMGKVMGAVNSRLAGRSDGKTISTIVKARLSSSN